MASRGSRRVTLKRRESEGHCAREEEHARTTTLRCEPVRRILTRIRLTGRRVVYGATRGCGRVCRCARARARTERKSGFRKGTRSCRALTTTGCCCCWRPPLLTGAQDGRHRSWRACAPRPSARQIVPPAALRCAPHDRRVPVGFFFRRARGRRPDGRIGGSASDRRRSPAPPATPARAARRRCYPLTTAARIARRARDRVSLRRSTCRRAQSPGNTAPVASAPSSLNRRT